VDVKGRESPRKEREAFVPRAVKDARVRGLTAAKWERERASKQATTGNSGLHLSESKAGFGSGVKILGGKRRISQGLLSKKKVAGRPRGGGEEERKSMPTRIFRFKKMPTIRA